MPTHAHPSDQERLLAALSYIWILFVLPFVLGQHKAFVKQHARQGLILFIFEVILLAIGWFPLIGWAIAFAGWLFVVTVSLIGIAHALSGKPYNVPFLHKFFVL